jgi:caffeoyl-CoA O-methyltransferase
MSKQIIPGDIEQYAIENTTVEIPVLAKLNRETNMKVPQAVMLSGHLQGTLLQMISRMVNPDRVLEIGTFTGYSAICLAQGLSVNGVLHTIDIEEELRDMSAVFFAEAGLADKIVQHTGNAMDIIPAIDEQFDIVFIDADKPNYEGYYDLIFDKVKVGGFILADNVLYEGDVLLPQEQQSKNARAISSFNEKINGDKRVEHILLPIRDGLMLIRKVNS